jgi:hypothetical protein
MKIIDKLREELSHEDIVFEDGYEEKIESIRQIFSFYTYQSIKSIFGLPFRFIIEYRGCDGDHDSYHWVFALGNKMYMVDGSYHSDNGVECYGNITEVQEREKLVKEWVPV